MKFHDFDFYQKHLMILMKIFILIDENKIPQFFDVLVPWVESRVL
jgi:hypothetical protein